MSIKGFKIDPVKRDYILDSSGKPTGEDSTKTAAFFRLRIPRLKWLYAPNSKYGSDFYLIKKNATSSDGFRLTNIGEKALDPILEDGRASDIVVELTERSRNGAGLSITITETDKEPEETFFVPVGGIT